VSGEFTVTLSYEDYKAANWLLVRRKWLWRRLIIRFFIIGLFYSLIGIFLNHPSSYQNAAHTIIVGYVFALAVLCIGIVSNLFYIPLRTRLLFEESGTLHLARHIQFSDETISFKNEREQSELTWRFILKWTEDEKTLVLWRTSQSFLGIPKSQVSIETLNSLRQILINAGVKKI